MKKSCWIICYMGYKYFLISLGLGHYVLNIEVLYIGPCTDCEFKGCIYIITAKNITI